MKIDRENIAEAVNRALLLCSEQRAQASSHAGGDEALQIAQRALELIDAELRSGRIDARKPRSGMFSRYLVDEEPMLNMDPVLKKMVLEIEDVYRHM